MSFAELVARGRADALASERRVLSEKATRGALHVDDLKWRGPARGKRKEPGLGRGKRKGPGWGPGSFLCGETAAPPPIDLMRKRVRKKVLQHLAPVLSDETLMQGAARVVLPRGYPGNRVAADVRNGKGGGTGKETVDFWKTPEETVNVLDVEHRLYEQPAGSSFERNFLERTFLEEARTSSHCERW